MAWEPQLDAGARNGAGLRAAICVEDLHRGAMARGDFPDDRKAQAAAVHARAQNPVEAVENAFALLGRDAGAGVLYGEDRVMGCFAHDDRDAARRRRVAQRVIDQVVEDFGQQQRVAPDQQGIVRAFEPQVIAHRQGLVHPLQRAIARQCHQVAGHHADAVRVFRVGHLQQLVDQLFQLPFHVQ